MLIEGPFRVGIVENDVGGELHLDFTEAFRHLTLTEQGPTFEAYIAYLRQAIADTREDSADRHGMLTILQIAEQLSPHIAAGEIPLTETIVVEIRPDYALGKGIAGININ